MTDTVFIEKPDGRRLGPYKGVLSRSQFTIMDKTLDVDHGDLLVRPLPNGKEEHYTVLRADFREDFHAIPGGYDLSINKKQQIHSRPSSIVNNVSISNSSGFQVGNRNLQSVQVALTQLLQAIESHPGSPEGRAVADRVLTCVYCGHQYPQETPAWGDKVLTDHITQCEKHPMRAVIVEREKLLAALIASVGCIDLAELRQMEAAMRLLYAPEADKAATIDAIHALIESIEGGSHG